MNRKIIIGSRGSDLALWQANFVKDKLENLGATCEIKIISTKGDQIQNLSFDKMAGKGFFTKEIEEALLNSEIDIAVHSHKDLETEQPKGLEIAAVSYREDPSELLLINKQVADTRKKWSLPSGATVGTSSARRKNQLLSFRPDIALKDLRGNVPTRINKLRQGEYDAIMLAAAGVDRLAINLAEFHTERLDPKEFIPAPAQGVLAIQSRSEDSELQLVLTKLNDKEVQSRINVERKVLNLFEGGCQMPLGAYCEYNEEEKDYHLWAVRAEKWERLPQRIYFASKNPDKLAQYVVDKFRAIKPLSIYITRTLNEHSYFKRILAGSGFEVIGQALIEIKQVEFDNVEPTDWIFFSSPNSVKYFFKQKPEIGNAKLAAISKGTADALRRVGKRATFIGASTDTKMVGKQFGAMASGTVLFPRAKISMRTIQKCLPEDRVVERVVYYTKSYDDFKIPKVDVVLFTSPSNVEAYFKHHGLPEHTTVIALGNATANTLKRHKVYKPIMPIGFDEPALAQCVFGISAE